jgi:hypothetical protein
MCLWLLKFVCVLKVGGESCRWLGVGEQVLFSTYVSCGILKVGAVKGGSGCSATDAFGG